MEISMQVSKLLKRTQMNSIIYNNKVAYKFLSLFINHGKLPNINKAREYISNYSPKPLGNCLTKNQVKEPVYDLKIIIPAYNVEQYVDDCLLSILSQETDYTFTVTVINDGSTDNTKSILEKYENNTQINIINQLNQGVSAARNTGLLELNSRYLMFVDSDDKLESNAIQSLLSHAFENKSDIVEGSYYSFFNKDIILNKNLHKSNINVKALGKLRGFPWMKVIKSSLFENIKYPEGYWYEDTIISYLIFPQCKNASTISDVVYWYRRNPKGNTIASKKKNKCIDTFWILEQMLEDMKKLNIEKTQDIYEETLKQIHLNFIRTQFMDDEVKKSIFILSANIIKTHFKNYNSLDHNYKELEYSLRNNDYNKYFMFCSLY